MAIMKYFKYTFESFNTVVSSTRWFTVVIIVTIMTVELIC